MLEAEVFVLGAGPAGACAAANLAPLRATVIADRRMHPAGRLVESLPPVAGRLLADMGLLQAFLEQGHPPWQVKRSVWERSETEEVDLLRDPDGLGWQVDRSRFDQWLRSVAVARGALLLAPARVVSVTTERDGAWLVELRTAGGPLLVRARVLIDAAGRGAPLATRLGGVRTRLDRLVCAWVAGLDGTEAGGAGFGSFLEAVEDGWWYTAGIGGRRLLAFFSDADLPTARAVRDPAVMVERARHGTVELGELLGQTGFAPGASHGVTAAHSSVLEPCAGPGWLAAGDAAVGFDPVSSQGLLTALVTGLSAAEAADRCLSGQAEPFTDHVRAVADISRAYQHNLRDCYTAGGARWPTAPFWARRMVP